MEAAQPPAPTLAKRISVGEVISETFSTYGRNAGVLLGSALVIFIVVGLISGILLHSRNFFLFVLATMVDFAGRALYTGVVVKLVQDVREERGDQTVGELISTAAPFILPLVGFGVLYGIGVTLGFLFLVVPGLILTTIWSVGPPALVVERLGPINAFRRSQDLVADNGWSVFGVLVIALLIEFGIGIGLSTIAKSLSTSEVSYWISSIVSSTITAPIFALAVSVLYFELSGSTGRSRT